MFLLAAIFNADGGRLQNIGGFIVAAPAKIITNHPGSLLLPFPVAYVIMLSRRRTQQNRGRSVPRPGQLEMGLHAEG
jgi:hypothetical protein